MAKSVTEKLFQSKFRNEKHKANLAILLLGHQIQNRNADLLKEFDLTPQQYNVLRILRGQLPNPATIILIKERLIDKMSDVSRVVERLRKAELVERCINDKNRRSVDVSLTEKGKNILTKIDTIVEKFDELGELSEAEAKQLTQLIERILE